VSWVPAERVIATIQGQRQILAAEEARVAQFARYHATERAKLDAERTGALRELGRAVLPRLDHAAIAACAQAVGLVGLPAENIPAQVEARRAWLASRLGAIVRDPRYANRELLRHPRTGSLPTAIGQNMEYRQPAAAVVAACDAHPRFGRMWAEGFGTAQAGTPWWRYSYWQDRSAADEIMKAFPGKTTFAEVRDAYARATQDLAVFDAEIASLRAQIAAGEALDREYAALHAEHRDLDARALEQTRGRILGHVMGTDASLMAQRLRAQSALLMLFLRASGVSAKLSYLDGIQHAKLGEIRQDIAAQHQRLAAAEMKTRRRWAPMPIDRFQKLNEDRRPRYEKRWQRFGKTYTTVHAYNQYNRARYYEDVLWWDLMTRGRYDGSYLPDVVHFHRTHPHYQFDPDWKTRQEEWRAERETERREATDADTDGATGDIDATADDTTFDAGADDADAAAVSARDGQDGDPTDTTRTDAS
jgi:hypothetical protein